MAKFRGPAFDLVLDLGTYEMRLLRLESAVPGEIRLKKCFSVESPREFVVSTYIENPIIDATPVERAVKSLVAKAQASYENVMVLVPDHFSLVNLVVAPPKYSQKESLEALREDFAPIMPLPIENWFIVHKPIGLWEEDEITVGLAAVKNNLLETGGIVQKAGLNPQVFDINFFNVANLLETHLVSQENRGKNIAIVHLGNETTSVGVFRDGQIRTFLNRPVGGFDFTKQIAKHFHVPDSEGEQFKKKEVFFLPEYSPEQENVYNFTVVRNVFSTLSREIFSTIENYLTRFREFTVHEIILSGGGANFQNIAITLAANLNTTVTYASDYFKVFIEGKVLDATDANCLAPACGAFLRE